MNVGESSNYRKIVRICEIKIEEEAILKCLFSQFLYIKSMQKMCFSKNRKI